MFGCAQRIALRAGRGDPSTCRADSKRRSCGKRIESEESLRVVQERYQLGLATILELQDAQITLTQAEVDLVNGRFQYEAALAGIEALLGRRLDQPQP
ncbi:MAG: TolC family protein [Gemmatimonadota bacterium]|uniref:TolC family protein n=1 Tax=Candidatus Palauibacter scopulicola TaxID=3056741 RepID=UPI00239F123A|nr:TolC family protein [Candidatus Palauibacter scopulicola]MDE2661715.1 TolC family protein [Candidatus Palauibacter scopulicola]